MIRSFKIKEKHPRVIFLGNSNVGKSSLIRYIIRNKYLTRGKIGKKAGSTISMLVYKTPKLPYWVVDLPGFGAMTRTPIKYREKIYDEIINYVERDKENIFLGCVVVNGVRIIDEIEKWYFKNQNTIPLSIEFIKWLWENDISSILIINKIDKLKKSEINKIERMLKEVIKEENIPFLGKEDHNDQGFNDNSQDELDGSIKVPHKAPTKSNDNGAGLLEIIPVSARTGENLEILLSSINEKFIKKYPQYASFYSFNDVNNKSSGADTSKGPSDHSEDLDLVYFDNENVSFEIIEPTIIDSKKPRKVKFKETKSPQPKTKSKKKSKKKTTSYKKTRKKRRVSKKQLNKDNKFMRRKFKK
ncbi:MAG: GTPase [Promethearchaeota archaeon]